jgi:20S proteasome alpha/beta subunit
MMGSIMPEPLKHIKDYFGRKPFSDGRILLPEPLKKRIPERKRMTIAIGLMAKDGVVIAADTEENAGYVKTSGHKILLRSTNGKSIAITGSGGADYLDSIAQDLEEEFLKRSKTPIAKRLKKIFVPFYQQHVLDLYKYPNFRDDNDPAFRVIIGIESPATKERTILSNDRMAFRSSADHIAVGAGAREADKLLGRIHSPSLTVERAALVAAYTIFTVKDSSTFCGKNTEVFMLTRGECIEFGEHQYKTLDSIFEEYASLEPFLIHYMLGRPAVRGEDQAKRLMESLDKVRAQILQIVEGEPHPFTEGSHTVQVTTRQVRGRNERGRHT